MVQMAPNLRTLVLSTQSSSTWQCGAWTPSGVLMFRASFPSVVVEEVEFYMAPMPSWHADK